MENESIFVQAHLFSNNSPESAEAKKLLDKSAIIYKEAIVSKSNGVTPPALIAREGDFIGLPRVIEYIEIVSKRPQLSNTSVSV